MRILSKFRDFYDNVSHQYLDKGIVYVRDSLLVQMGKVSLPETLKFTVQDSKNNRTFEFNYAIIGFCGKLYPVVSISIAVQEFKPDQYRKDMLGFYDIETLREHILQNQIPIEEGKRYRWFYSYGETFKDMELFFESTKNFKTLEEFFVRYNVPTFLLKSSTYRRDQTLYLNPILKNFSFQKVKDPFSAHQELYQYVGGYLLQPERAMIQISDKDKIHKHGFDKWSFRKPPKGKK